MEKIKEKNLQVDLRMVAGLIPAGPYEDGEEWIGTTEQWDRFERLIRSTYYQERLND